MALQSIDVITSLIDYFDTDMKSKCVCKCELKKVYASQTYNDKETGSTICCNICYEEIDESMRFWHCPMEYNYIHLNGYDICNDCYIKGKQVSTCVCGKALQRVLLSLPNFVECMKCKSYAEFGDDYNDNLIFWYCPSEYNMCHPDGYFICNECLIKDTEVTQHSNDSMIPPLTPRKPCDCSQNITCAALQNFVVIMKQYNEKYMEIANNMDGSQLIEIVNNYIHLIHQHNDDKQFNAILDELGFCDITKCLMFRRNNRNRLRFNDNDNEIDNDYNVILSFMDKMHCYFQHSCDTGYRLSMQDKETINKMIERNGERKLDITDQLLFDIEKAQIIQFLQEKKKKNREIYSDFKEKIHDKYNELFVWNDEIQIDVEQKENIYGFGYEFIYGYDDEDAYNFTVKYINGKKVSPKHTSFKDELINNKLAKHRLNIHQYKHEYKKAQILFNSEHCKTSKDFENVGDDIIFTLENLLALMIYTNYTELQCEFSKTYRENNGDNHQYFWYWGKSFKITIQYFGRTVDSDQVYTFYHGIDRPLYFSKYIGNSIQQGIYINGPISTSSSFAVASQFATNEGLIVELQVNELAYGENYLSLEWLSDFAKEKEYLFVQGRPMVFISNVTEVKTKIEYRIVLKALTLIEMLFDGKYDAIELEEESMRTMIKAILEGRLSNIMPKYRKFESISIYGKQMIKTFFGNRYELKLHYWLIRKYYSFILDFLVYLDFEWVKFHCILALCPNLNHIIVSNIKLTRSIFENIFEIMPKMGDNINLTEIHLNTLNTNNSEIQIESAMNEYSSKFTKLGAFIYGQPEYGEISFIRCNKVDFIMRMIIDFFNGKRFTFSDEIQSFAQRLIVDRLTFLNHNDDDQVSFNNRCDELENINMKYFGLDTEWFPVELLSHLNIEDWIQINELVKLFPNLNSVTIYEIELTPTLMKDILIYLDGTALNQVSITNPIEDEWCRQDIVEKYKDQFAALNWRMEVCDWPELLCEKCINYK